MASGNESPCRHAICRACFAEFVTLKFQLVTIPAYSNDFPRIRTRCGLECASMIYVSMDSYKERSRGKSYPFSNHHANQLSTRQDFLNSSYNTSSRSSSNSPSSSRVFNSTFFECRVCLNTYPSKTDLHNHLVKEKHQRPYNPNFAYADAIVSRPQGRKRKVNGFSCKVCLDDFVDFRELQSHISKSGHYYSAIKQANFSPDLETSLRKTLCHKPQRRSSTSSDSVRTENVHSRRSPVNLSSGNRGVKKRTSSLTECLNLVDSIPSTQDDVMIVERNQGEPSTKHDSERTPRASSSKSLTYNLQPLDITSPENSSLQHNAPEETPSSGNQDLMTVIPMEPRIQTSDPRSCFSNDKKQLNESDPTQANKWTPLYRDCPKPSACGKNIPWKLIPIDFSPKTPSFQPSPKIPTPADRKSPEDTFGASIDQLVAQLKENTGATFMPVSVLGAEPSSSSFPFEESGPYLNRHVIPSNVSCNPSSLGDLFHPTATPLLDDPGQKERNSASLNTAITSTTISNSLPAMVSLDTILTAEDLALLNEGLEPRSSQNSSDGATGSVNTALSGKDVPTTLVPTTDSPTETTVTTLDRSSSSLVNKTPEPAVVPTYKLSEALSSNTQTLNAFKPSLSETGGNASFPNKVVDKVPASSVSPYKTDAVLVSLNGISSKGDLKKDKNANLSLPPSTQPSPSTLEPLNRSRVIEKLVENCLRCKTTFDICRMSIDLKTKNVSVMCKECGTLTIMKNVYKTR